MAATHVRTRFAPSPTGFLHIGGLRTALYAYALAKHNRGDFILRVEDTDTKRQVPGATQKIMEILHLFGLHYDEGPDVGGPHGPYIQSERVSSGIYQKFAQKLLDSGRAFYCFCQPKTKEEILAERERKISFRDPCHYLSDDKIQELLASGIKPAVRLKVPDGEVVSYTDFVLGKSTTWKTDVVDDAMLLKSDDFPTYHLAVVVDDYDMGVTHMLRGHDWMPSTPIQLLLYKYLLITPPQIGHLTDILSPTGQGKLSKRKGNVSCEQFISDGYLPEALLNFVLLLGWAPKDNQEIFTLEEFVAKFDPAGFQKSNPRFDISKLNWLNGQYIRKKSDLELLTLVRPLFAQSVSDELLLKVIPLAKERIQKLADIADLIGFIFHRPEYAQDIAINQQYLKDIISTLEKADWTKESIESGFNQLTSEKKYPRGDFFMTLRLAVSGRSVTPPLTESMLIIGKEEVLSRLRNLLS